MIRSSAWLALLACSVARHRWPVSAKAIACSIVSRSRISPIRITSGAWRSVFFSAASQLSVSTPTSRCVIDAVLVRVHVLDRVLDRDDVAVAVLVAVADHRRQRGRLARAGARRRRSPGRAWSSRRPSAPAAGSGRRTFGMVGGDRAQHHADAALLHEGVDAEAADARRA